MGYVGPNNVTQATERETQVFSFFLQVVCMYVHNKHSLLIYLFSSIVPVLFV